MRTQILDEEIAQARKELIAMGKILTALKRLPEPVKRAQVLKAAAILHGVSF